MLDKFAMQELVDNFLRDNGILCCLVNPEYYFALAINYVCLKNQKERDFEKEKNVLFYAITRFFSERIGSYVFVYFCVSPYEEDLNFYSCGAGDVFNVYAYVYNEASPWCSEFGFVTVDKNLKVLSL